MKVMAGLYYSKDHEWVKVEGNKAYIGITDFAQSQLGDIVFVEQPEVDDSFEAGDDFGVVESVKAASDLYIPLSGTVVEVNEELADDPAKVNEDPYGSWMIAIEMTKEDELKNLLTPSDYEKVCDEEA
ncbi:glycine cleavage system H protein [Alkaliphilus metalliredigens QYMF]|uniref:Glycine cleavage system H protein n=1 Tax=Alkaliphilus metalliredigens (strain QYMF) TaxID=293826 RepID=A6TMY7_ALKMQ|nr:glycine cleavage system protein GcvH [Alkaliphilus metalliredigens]ABR47555.1 glycine cleavage system H protein [Alkaliphilus metalliredigens QYMF]